MRNKGININAESNGMQVVFDFIYARMLNQTENPLSNDYKTYLELIALEEMNDFDRREDIGDSYTEYFEMSMEALREDFKDLKQDRRHKK